MEELEGKALGEGSGAAGGVLVKPEYGAEVPMRMPGDPCPECGKKMHAGEDGDAMCAEHGKPDKKTLIAFEALVREVLDRQIKGAHTHAKVGGGKNTHTHEDANPGHGHPADDLLPTLKAKSDNDAELKRFEPFEYSFDLKAIRTERSGTLILEGHANTWLKDRDGETTAHKAFDDTLTEYMTNPILLYQHDADKPIGFITSAVPDEIGLKITAEVPKPDPGSEPWHIKVYNDIKRKVLKTLSMGGVFIRSKSIEGLIETVKLYEISVVTIPSNQASLFSVAEEKGFTGWENKNTVLARSEKEVPMSEDNTPAEDAGDVKDASGGLDAKTTDALLGRLEALEAEKKAVDMERAAEAEAERRLQGEMEREEAKRAAEAVEQKRINDLVEQKLTTMRSTKKFQFSGEAPAQHNHEDESKNLGDWLRLLVRKKNGDFDAFKKLEEMNAKAAEAYGIKALNEGSTGAGGFLVPPQYWQAGIAEFRTAAAKVRGLCSVISTNTNLVYIPRETGISNVGWTAENTAKPSTDQAFGQISVQLFTLAGISKVSNQLLEDSSPAVDQIVRKDLGRSLGQAEDVAFINGTGTGQPTGILNTSGIQTAAIGAAKLADALAVAITGLQSNYFADPSAILMHPREVNVLRTAKDLNGRYIFEPNFFAGGGPQMGGAGSFLASQPLGGGYSNYPAVSTAPAGSVWGYPVVADANVPTTLGVGTNESPVIVGNFEEAYVFERTGVTIDVSNEAGTSFETNQTWFRAECRLGFSAARQPLAFYVLTGMTPTAG